MSLTKRVNQKLDEYGIEIFNDYPIEEEGEHVFYAENMILFVSDDENSISVTFKATTKPERSATLALILNQIKNVTMNIMEAFIFDKDDQFVSGMDAYKAVERVDKEKLIQEYHNQVMLAELLESAECHEC